MADVRQKKTIGNRFRFLVRALGLLGVAAVAVGAVGFASVHTVPEQWTHELLRQSMHGDFAATASLILTIGAFAIVLMLVVELLSGLILAASRRTVASSTATIATIAAVALLGFVNIYSSSHYTRRDLTRDKQFTLPDNVADELKKLRPDEPTTIVVLQKHRTFGLATEMRDSYASESEAKVAEKVKDLVDQFREFGPRFNVVVLDTEQFGYETTVAALTDKKPELKAAIDAAPENSILFHANKRVQRLGFNEFLQLDRTASKQANDGRGNLVLMPQGVESFARRILAVQERRPRVAICVIHGALGTEGYPGYTHAGLKKTLTEHGFDVTDIVLKNWSGPELAAAAYTKQESKIEELEGELELASEKVQSARGDITGLVAVKDAVGKAATRPFEVRFSLYRQIFDVAKANSWLEVVAVYRTLTGKFDEKVEVDFKKDLLEKLDVQKVEVEKQIAEFEKERQAVDLKLTAVYRDERSVQDRRVTDVKAKFARLLAEVDLLVLPRFTTSDILSRRDVPSELHALDKDQVEAIRDYMKSGRPVLAMFGTITGADGPNREAQDGIEKLVGERGVEMGNDTLLYNFETKQLQSQGIARQFSGGDDQLPTLHLPEFEDAGKSSNAIGEAIRRSGRNLEQPFELKLRSLRPVYIAEGWKNKLAYSAEFLFTDREAWNELKPFPRGDPASGRITYIPKFEATKDSDAKKGTHAEERRGPFPVAVAVDGPLPLAWYERERTAAVQARSAVSGWPVLGVLPALESVDLVRQQSAAALMSSFDLGLSAAMLTVESKRVDRSATSRLVVFGHGGVFVGAELKPSQEKLLLHSANWLLNRTDRLPSAPEKAWSYPRVNLSEQDVVLWRWGTGLLMPLGVVVFGLFAVMMRKTR